MNIQGMHHFTGITKDAVKNKAFYTEVLGLRLVKVSVNQDTGNNFHLFYADAVGNPGTDYTFFEFKNAGRTHFGTNSISRTSFRVKDDAALTFWHERLREKAPFVGPIYQVFGMKVFNFTDENQQRLMMVSDDNKNFNLQYVVNEHKEIPKGYEIIGLGPVFLTVRNTAKTVRFLHEVLAYDLVGAYENNEQSETKVFVLESKNSGHHSAIHVHQDSQSADEKPGYGSVHHIALSVNDDEALEYWAKRLDHFKFKHSGILNRLYFSSLYVQDDNGIQYEISNLSPGFTVDEKLANLGNKLSLPEKLEFRREKLEKEIDFL